MDFWLFVYCTVASLVLLSLVFLYARLRDRFDIIDVFWGITFIVIALTSYFLQPEDIKFLSLQTLVTALVIAWGARLAGHIFLRWKSSEKEDKRYVSMRKDYEKKPGGMVLNMFGRVFMVQALLAVVVSMPVIVVNASTDGSLGILALVGFIVWATGFYFEDVGDYQLKQFIADPKRDGLMTSGLWKYTRHPNYFGEVTQWWGIFIIALSVPFWWISIIGPIVITILIVFISGVPMTEKHFEGRDGWSEYKKKTSIFFPFPPKK